MLDFTESCCLLSRRYSIVSAREKKAAAQADKVSGGTNIFSLLIRDCFHLWKAGGRRLRFVSWSSYGTWMPLGPVEMITLVRDTYERSINLVVCWPRTPAGLPHLTPQVSEQAREWMSLDIRKKSYFPRGGRKGAVFPERKIIKVAKKKSFQSDYWKQFSTREEWSREGDFLRKCNRVYGRREWVRLGWNGSIIPRAGDRAQSPDPGSKELTTIPTIHRKYPLAQLRCRL